MAEAPLFLRDLAIILTIAAVTTVVFQRLHQPVVVGYILAGFLVLYRSQPFDLLIVDLIMPEKDGLEVIQELREEKTRACGPPPSGRGRCRR